MQQKRSIRGLHLIGDGSTAAGRLVKARVDAGYASATSAADDLGFTRTTYQQHENGTRALTREAAETYARLLRVSPGYLLYGEPAFGKTQGVPVVGTISRGGSIIKAMGSPLDTKFAVAPPLASQGALHALIVDTDDLFPAYRRGDAAFYDPTDENNFAADRIDNRECVVSTADGRRLLRLCNLVAGGWLLSVYADTAPEITQLASAAPVLWVQRAIT